MFRSTLYLYLLYNFTAFAYSVAKCKDIFYSNSEIIKICFEK